MINTELLEKLKNDLSSDLHYLEKADVIAEFKSKSGLSERALAAALGISKSQIHRYIDLSRTRIDLRLAVLEHNTDFHVMARYWQTTPALRILLRPLILSGQIKRNKEASTFLFENRPSSKDKLQRKYDLLEAQLKQCKIELERSS